MVGLREFLEGLVLDDVTLGEDDDGDFDVAGGEVVVFLTVQSSGCTLSDSAGESGLGVIARCAARWAATAE